MTSRMLANVHTAHRTHCPSSSQAFVHQNNSKWWHKAIHWTIIHYKQKSPKCQFFGPEWPSNRRPPRPTWSSQWQQPMSNSNHAHCLAGLSLTLVHPFCAFTFFIWPLILTSRMQTVQPVKGLYWRLCWWDEWHLVKYPCLFRQSKKTK